MVYGNSRELANGYLQLTRHEEIYRSVPGEQLTLVMVITKSFSSPEGGRIAEYLDLVHSDGKKGFTYPPPEPQIELY